MFAWTLIGAGFAISLAVQLDRIEKQIAKKEAELAASTKAYLWASQALKSVEERCEALNNHIEKLEDELAGINEKEFEATLQRLRAMQQQLEHVYELWQAIDRELERRDTKAQFLWNLSTILTLAQRYLFGVNEEKVATSSQIFKCFT